MLRRSTANTPPKIGLALTLDALVKTGNEAAVDLLVSALDSPRPMVSEGALESLLKRRSILGHREIILRLAKLKGRSRELVTSRHRALGRALRDALLSSDPETFANGCIAALEFHDYDMLPTLVQAAEDQNNVHAKSAGLGVLKMAEMLYDDLSTDRESSGGRDPKLTRKHVLHSLEQSIARFGNHKRIEILESFLILAPRDYPALKRILNDPMHVAYRNMIDLLTNSQHSGIMRLMLSFLEDAEAPTSALNLLGRRNDPKFVEYFLRKIGSQPTSVAMQNLRRIDSVGWIQQNPRLIDNMDEAAQHGAIQLALACSMNRGAVFKLIEQLLRFGKPGGRRAAAAALAGFHGAEANLLAQEALSDPDPQVLVQIIPQLRPRGIPGTLPILLGMLDTKPEPVRAAIRRSLEEFSFDRYLAAFEMLDDSVRQTTGPVVRKVDPTAPKRLEEELQARSRTRRIRGAAIAAAMNLAPELESALIERLSDEDHLVRAEAAKALGQSPSDATRNALVAARRDRSVVVREAIEDSLSQLGMRGVLIDDESYESQTFDYHDHL